MKPSILAYGASAGLLIALLRFIDYRFLVIKTGEQRTSTVRLPLLDRAVTILIPFGWYMQ